MELKSFDTLLTQTCDEFDTLIAPDKVARSNTNIFYLVFKAISKGWEIINNVCVALNNKFNPASCSADDLVSVGKLVGTKMRPGAVSGLRISVYNSSALPVTLSAGTYTYSLNEDVTFTFDLNNSVSIASENSVFFTALSERVGAYHVTQQTNIAVTSDRTIPSTLSFSCSDNQALLGYEPETILEFRQRVNTDTTRQDTISELREKLLALPYVYDCSIVFNQSESPAQIGAYEIRPYFMLISVSTAKYTDEMARIVVESAIYPTVQTENSHELQYNSEIFANGHYSVYFNDFDLKDFRIILSLYLDTNYVSRSELRNKITQALQNAFNTNIHRDYITAEDVFNELAKVDLSGTKVLDVDFEVDGIECEYIEFLRTELPNLTEVGGI